MRVDIATTNRLTMSRDTRSRDMLIQNPRARGGGRTRLRGGSSEESNLEPELDLSSSIQRLAAANRRTDILSDASGYAKQRNELQQKLNEMGVGNPLSRPLYDGELHAVSLKGSKYPGSQHSYTGPKTQLAKRLARGDPPINAVDAVSKQHDIDYSQAKNAKDVRAADKRAIKGYSDPKIAREDPVVAKIARNTFKAKIITDATHLTNPMKYTGEGKISLRPITDRDPPKLRDIEEEAPPPPIPKPGYLLRQAYDAQLKKMRS
jgi:hypothetical protein